MYTKIVRKTKGKYKRNKNLAFDYRLRSLGKRIGNAKSGVLVIGKKDYENCYMY